MLQDEVPTSWGVNTAVLFYGNKKKDGKSMKNTIESPKLVARLDWILLIRRA